MKKFLPLIIIFVLAVVCVVTCPDREAHKDALMSLVNNRINDKLGVGAAGEGSEDESEYEALSEGLSFLGATLASKIVGLGLDNSLVVKNHFLFSTGVLQRSSGQKIVSVGLLGHIFTASQKKFNRIMDSKKSELDSLFSDPS